MARARSYSGRASCSWPRIRRSRARLFSRTATVGVVGSVGGLGDGQGALQQRPGLGEPGVHLQVGSRPVEQPRGIIQDRGIAGCGGVQAGCGGQHVRQQHGPPGPRLRGTDDLAGSMRHAAAQVQPRAGASRNSGRELVDSAAVLDSDQPISHRAVLHLCLPCPHYCTAPVMHNNTTPYTAIPRCSPVHSQ